MTQSSDRDWRWIETPRIHSSAVAEWWATETADRQAAFLTEMMSALGRACKDGCGQVQLYDIGKYMGVDVNMGAVLDIRELVDASGHRLGD